MTCSDGEQGSSTVEHEFLNMIELNGVFGWREWRLAMEDEFISKEELKEVLGWRREGMEKG